MNNEVDIRPSLGDILNGYERQNYKPETAIAEFVDNSTASYFQNKLLIQTIYSNSFKLKIDISYNSGTKTLTIKDNAFSNNTNVVNVIISSGVNTIGSNAFMGCSNLVRVYIPHYVQEVGEYIFGNCAQNLTIYTDEDSSYSKYEQWDSTWNKYDSTTTYTVVYEYSLDSFMELI